LWEKYKSLVDKEVELVKSGKTEEARQLLLSDIDDIGDTLRDYFEALWNIILLQRRKSG